jgi:hypothetical protein
MIVVGVIQVTLEASVIFINSDPPLQQNFYFLIHFIICLCKDDSSLLISEIIASPPFIWNVVQMNI